MSNDMESIIKATITYGILSFPFIMIAWYLISLISLRVYRIVDRSYSDTSYFVLEYLSPVGWREVIAGKIPGDGWTYTVTWPESFHSLKEANAFCRKQNKFVWYTMVRTGNE